MARRAINSRSQTNWVEISTDAEQFRKISEAIAKVAKSLENGYSRWNELSDEIDKVKAKLGE